MAEGHVFAIVSQRHWLTKANNLGNDLISSSLIISVRCKTSVSVYLFNVKYTERRSILSQKYRHPSVDIIFFSEMKIFCSAEQIYFNLRPADGR